MSRYPTVIKTSMARTSTGGTARASAPAIGSSPACGERWRDGERITSASVFPAVLSRARPAIP